MPENTDPSKMTDEELNEILGEETPELDKEEPKKAPESKEKPKEEEKPAPVEESEEESEELEEVEKPVSKREQLRVQQLLAKYGEPKEQPKPKAEETLNYETALDADPELIAKLKEDREKSNQAYYNQGLEQANSIRFMTRLEIDAPRVEGKYTFLDKNSEDFNPLAADAMNRKYLQFVGFDTETQKVQHPDIRYSDFVEAEMEFANEIASHQIADTTKNIKKQAAQTGLRPDGSGAKKMNLNKPPEQMTDEELDAVIAQALPK